MSDITKAVIAREIVKITAGKYAARADPLFVATLQEHRGLRRWQLTYDGLGRWAEDWETSLEGVVATLRHVGRCAECGRHSGVRRLRTLAMPRGGARRVCVACAGECSALHEAFCRGKNAAQHADRQYDLVVAIRTAPNLTAALLLMGVPALPAGAEPPSGETLIAADPNERTTDAP